MEKLHETYKIVVEGYLNNAFRLKRELEVKRLCYDVNVVSQMGKNWLEVDVAEEDVDALRAFLEAHL